MPPLFKWLQAQGNIAEREMYRTFNCGIGMAVVVSPEHVQQAQKLLRASGEQVWRIGEIKKRAQGEPQTVVS
jgi:phosphoribosylformylglycinamidine cyclo-ligase